MLTEAARAHTLELVQRVLDEIGPECDGVQTMVDMVPIDGGVRAPAVILRWNPKIHPKTIHDPAQAIVIMNVATGKPLKDDTLRRVLRETIEKMISVDQHAHKELYPVGSLSIREGRDILEKELEQCPSTPLP